MNTFKKKNFIERSDIVDCNTVTTPKSYYCTSQLANGPQGTSYPVFFSVEVKYESPDVSTGTKKILQKVSGDVGEYTRVSFNNGTTWSEWKFANTFIPYRTGKQLTGYTWADGRPIYRKYFSVPGAVGMISFNIDEPNIDQCVFVFGMTTYPHGTCTTIPRASNGGDTTHALDLVFVGDPAYRIDLRKTSDSIDATHNIVLEFVEKI